MLLGLEDCNVKPKYFPYCCASVLYNVYPSPLTHDITADELFEGGEAHGWVCDVDDDMGIISWRSDKPEHGGMEILATPNWEDSGVTAVAYTKFDGEYHTLDTLPLFNSFEEYAEAMKPFLEHYKIMIESCQVLYEE